MSSTALPTFLRRLNLFSKLQFIPAMLVEVLRLSMAALMPDPMIDTHPPSGGFCLIRDLRFLVEVKLVDGFVEQASMVDALGERAWV